MAMDTWAGWSGKIVHRCPCMDRKHWGTLCPGTVKKSALTHPKLEVNVVWKFSKKGDGKREIERARSELTRCAQLSPGTAQGQLFDNEWKKLDLPEQNQGPGASPALAPRGLPTSSQWPGESLL